MSNPSVPFSSPRGLINREAEGTISAYRIIVNGSSDTQYAQATANTQKLIGISLPGSGPTAENMVANGDTFTLITEGVALVEYGGTVNRGDPLTTDAQGRAVQGGSGNEVIGHALVSGVEGNVGNCLIGRSQLP
jgi:hypothetical protein